MLKLFVKAYWFLWAFFFKELIDWEVVILFHGHIYIMKKVDKIKRSRNLIDNDNDTEIIY